MKVTMKKAAITLAAVAVTVSLATLTAAASETEEAAAPERETASYSYQTGRQRSSSRAALFESAASAADDAEREAFFAAQDIGSGSAYSAEQHLDAAALVEAGIIDQATADRIAAYASGKQGDIHARFQSKSGMTPVERHAFYEAFQSDGFPGDSVSELLEAGIITQEQAEAIQQYLAG